MVKGERSEQWPEYGIPPTRETAAKLKSDVVIRLYRQGVLRRRHVLAAEEIRKVVEGITIAMFPARNLSTDGRPKHAETRTWLDRLPEPTRRLWLDRYDPWKYQMAENCGSGTLLELVYDVVVENRGLRETEERMEIRHGSACHSLRRALNRWWKPADQP